jgi:hypothetical protein
MMLRERNPTKRGGGRGGGGNSQLDKEEGAKIIGIYLEIGGIISGISPGLGSGISLGA